MFPVCVIAVLLLVSVSHSAPLTCKDLVRPLDQLDPRHLEGRRAMVAGSVSRPSELKYLRLRDSATTSFSNNTSENNITFSRDVHVDNKCYNISYNISLEGSSFTFENGNATTTFIHTSCPDCILMRFDDHIVKRQHFYLFSRRRQLEQREMEEFRAQMECLNMPPPVEMDPTKDLCPEDTAGDPAEEKTEGQKD